MSEPLAADRCRTCRWYAWREPPQCLRYWPTVLEPWPGGCSEWEPVQFPPSRLVRYWAAQKPMLLASAAFLAITLPTGDWLNLVVIALLIAWTWLASV